MTAEVADDVELIPPAIVDVVAVRRQRKARRDTKRDDVVGVHRWKDEESFWNSRKFHSDQGTQMVWGRLGIPRRSSELSKQRSARS